MRDFADGIQEMWGSLEGSMSFSLADNQAPPLAKSAGAGDPTVVKDSMAQAVFKSKTALQNINVLKIKVMEATSEANDAGGEPKRFADRMLSGATSHLQELCESYEFLAQHKRIRDA
jgi:hypothetical protein